jgi:hypothetical protein
MKVALMDRVSWLRALGRAQEKIFSEGEFLTSFTSTGYRVESILSHDPKSALNVPEIYEKLKNLMFLLRKLLENLKIGSTQLLELEVDGDLIKFSSFRIGHQRRLNLLTPVEVDQSRLILSFITAVLSHYPDKPQGVVGEGETGVPSWSQGTEQFFLSSALSDTNSLVERLSLELGIGQPATGTLKGINDSNFELSCSPDSSKLLLVECNDSQEIWTSKLTQLFSRVTKDQIYDFPSEYPELPSSPNKIVSQLILRRFLAYLLPPLKTGRISFKKLEYLTGMHQDLLIHYFDTMDEDNLVKNHIELKHEQTKKGIDYYLIIHKPISRERVLSHHLQKIKAYEQQLQANVPTKATRTLVRSTSEFLARFWGSHRLMQFLGESDNLDLIYHEITKEIQELRSLKMMLPEIRKGLAEKKAQGDEIALEAVTQQLNRLISFLEQRIDDLNLKISRFISELVQSYYLLITALGCVPSKILSPEVNDPSEEGLIEFVVILPEEKTEVVRQLKDELQAWIVLSFFDCILFKKEKGDFIQSLNPVLYDYWQTLEMLWDLLELLSIDSPEETWEALTWVQEIFIKSTTRRSMLNKIRALMR